MARACLFAIAVFSTFFCTAVNAYTLQVGYPLWRSVGQVEFAAVHREYLRRLDWVITVPHIVMFFSTALLVVWRPPTLGAASAWTVAALAWAVVAVSAFMAGPIHDRFRRSGQLDAPGLRRLLVISAARTGMMLAASLLLSFALIDALR